MSEFLTVVMLAAALPPGVEMCVHSGLRQPLFEDTVPHGQDRLETTTTTATGVIQSMCA